MPVNALATGTVLGNHRLDDFDPCPPFAANGFGIRVGGHDGHGFLAQFAQDLDVRAVNPKLDFAAFPGTQGEFFHVDRRVGQHLLQVILHLLVDPVDDLVILDLDHQAAILLGGIHRYAVGQDESGVAGTHRRRHRFDPFDIQQVGFHPGHALLRFTDVGALAKLAFHLEQRAC